MKKILILTTFISMLFFACGNNQTQETQSEDVVQEEHQHDHESEAIETNNGQKWKVDENMMVYIQNMENAVAQFKGTSLSEYKTLSESVNENIGLLTSNCTMTGKAHDELHKWLVPHIDLANKFSESGTQKEAETHFKQIEKSFTSFNQYFQ